MQKVNIDQKIRIFYHVKQPLLLLSIAKFEKTKKSAHSSGYFGTFLFTTRIVVFVTLNSFGVHCHLLHRRLLYSRPFQYEIVQMLVFSLGFMDQQYSIVMM